MSFLQPTPRDRLRAGVPSLLVTALIGWALVAGLGIAVPSPRDATLAVFDVAPPPPPPPPPRVVPEPMRSTRPRGEAAPPNLRSRATELVAPPPLVPPVEPPPLITAPVAGPGAEASSGSAERPGPGTGAGGVGSGYGSGGAGDGDGDDGDFTPPRLRRGALRDSDRPAAAGSAQGTVSVRYRVEVDGRVTDCRVTRSSGNAALDMTTCALIERRFRYAPSRDPQGQPVRSIVVGNHEWLVERSRDDVEW